MSDPRVSARALGLLAVLLVLSGVVLRRIRRRRWSEHDVSDPGITL